MNTDPKGENRPKPALLFSIAHDIDTCVLRLAEELNALLAAVSTCILV